MDKDKDDETREAPKPQVIYAVPQAMAADDSDEIDLRELWKTLMRRKFVVLGITVLAVLAALVYVFTAQPVYTSKAVVGIGNYPVTDSNGNIKIQVLDKSDNLVQYINTRYGVSASIQDKKADFISLSANGSSPEAAREKVSTVVEDILARHQMNYDSIAESSATAMKLMEKQIEYYQGILPVKKQELETLLVQQNSGSMANSETGYLLNAVIAGKSSEIRDIEGRIVPELELKVLELNKTLHEPFLKKTFLVGDISAPTTPVKPNKKMILAVALVAGLMMGVFLVFFLEFIKKDEK